MGIIDEITIVGSGNVARHLAKTFIVSGIAINKVISRNIKNASMLGNEIGVAASDNLKDIPKNSKLVLLCVSDGALEKLAPYIRSMNFQVAHTAGSVPLSVFGDDKRNTGVFYPFQTFTKNVREGDVKFPLCIEAGSEEMLESLKKLANMVSDSVVVMNSEQRKQLHISGIVANNFSNFIFGRAFEYLNSKKIDSKLLIPLIEETVQKIRLQNPDTLQTGPAVRRSNNIIEEHIEYLKGNNDLKELYSFLSKSIMSFHERKNE